LRNFCTTLIAVWRGQLQDLLLFSPEQATRSATVMKNPLIFVPLLLITFVAPCMAQPEANPFIKKPDAAKPAQTPGASFASLLENFLIPPDLLDDWLQAHPLKEDATELRAAVQGWVMEGKARFDHTNLGLGVAGLANLQESVLEQTYPTEFEPNGDGTWPLPTAFEIRNLGQSFESGVCSIDGVTELWSRAEHLEMISSKSYQLPIDRTRQPEDVFLPKIRTMRISSGWPTGADPFSDRTKLDLNEPHDQGFKPDITQLAGRFDPLSESSSEENLSRLVFYRGAISAPGQSVNPKAGEISRLSFRTMRVSLPEFSSWIQNRSPLLATTEAWQAAEAWKKKGKASNIGELTTKARLGDKSTLENIEELIYPTEYAPANETVVMAKWEVGKKIDGKEGVATMEKRKIQPISGIEGAANGTAFDTRNLGNSIDFKLNSDPSGLIMDCVWERVRHIQDSVYHRIQVDGEWIPDVTMPLFERNLMMTSVRLQPGQWTLMGVESEFLKTRKPDPEHCLLVFVKAE
jgi:hypothetical protein